LTQDIPPEEHANILLLGCGDARHVLFTTYNDNKFGKTSTPKEHHHLLTMRRKGARYYVLR
jgi:hypothetical protein